MLLMLDAARFASYPQLLLLADSRIVILHALRSAASISIPSPPFTAPPAPVCCVHNPFQPPTKSNLLPKVPR
jgi:hypothetical protein